MGALGAKLSSYSEDLLTALLLKFAPILTVIIRYTILVICILWKQYELWSSSSIYTTIMNSKSTKFVYLKHEQEQCCSICLSDFQKGDSCSEIVDCNHVFHKKCLEKWLRGYCATCPLCRAVVVPEPIAAEHRLLQVERKKLTERLCRFSNGEDDASFFFI